MYLSVLVHNTCSQFLLGCTTYELSKERNTNTDDVIKIERIGGILPYVSYEESKRIYNKVQNDVSAVIDAVSSSNRCNQPLCDGEDRSFTSEGMTIIGLRHNCVCMWHL